jgi:hypothetical protein
MRGVGIVVAGAVAGALVLPVLAANPLSSADISAEFGTGATIKGTTIPGGATYELSLNTDGTGTMKLLKGDKAARTGTWRLSQTGYCSRWEAADEHCYTIVANGKAFDVVNNAGKVIARWTK